MNHMPPAAGKGRPKGSRNKTTVAFKEAVMLAAEDLGGAERLAAWARESPLNEKVFWSQIFTRLAPLQGLGDNQSSYGTDVESPLAKIERRLARLSSASSVDG